MGGIERTPGIRRRRIAGNGQYETPHCCQGGCLCTYRGAYFVSRKLFLQTSRRSERRRHQLRFSWYVVGAFVRAAGRQKHSQVVLQKQMFMYRKSPDRAPAAERCRASTKLCFSPPPHLPPPPSFSLPCFDRHVCLGFCFIPCCFQTTYTH